MPFIKTDINNTVQETLHVQFDWVDDSYIEVTLPGNFDDYPQNEWTYLDGVFALVSDAGTVSLDDIRSTRDGLLSSSDWRVSVSDYPNSDIAAWVTYRDLLRDFPSTYIPTDNPVWPQPPA